MVFHELCDISLNIELLNRGYLSLLLERIPLTSKNKALKVLRVCRKYDLIEQSEGATSYMQTDSCLQIVFVFPFHVIVLVQIICKVMSLHDCQNGELASALHWCLLAKVSIIRLVISLYGYTCNRKYYFDMASFY